jgi:hypothetical protein
MRPTLFLLPFLLLACDSGAPSADASGAPEGIRTPPPPPQLCDQARQALQKLGAGMVYDDQGQATIPRDAWMGMAAQRDALTRTLGIHAACVHPDGKPERQVVIHDESGLVLTEAIVPVAVDLGALDQQ